MKKLLLLITFVGMAITFANAAFVPNASELYNIKQTNSGLVIGAISNVPCLQTINQRKSQAFKFIPVPGLVDTYYLKNEDENYLNKVSNGDYWSVTYEKTTTGTNSEWIIEGESTAFRLKLTNNSLYLASDNTTNGAGIYCDKSADHVNGVFELTKAEVIYEFFEIAEKDMVIGVEKDHQSYPINFTTGGVFETIYARATTGFSLNKGSFTQEEVSAAGGKLSVRVSSTAAVGTEGKVYFTLDTGPNELIFDSISVVSVAKYKRNFIINTGDKSMVIGNHSTAAAPALTVNIDAISQKFIIQPVNPLLNDSLYYIIQDGDYRMMIKEVSSNWSTVFGVLSDEAKWKIVPQGDGTSAIYNFVTKKALGTDGITADSRLYDDKVFSPAPTAKPYCEWIIVDAESSAVPIIFTVSDNNYVLEIEKDFQSHPIYITTSGIKENFYATADNGFNLDKTTFSTDDVLSGKGSVTLRVSTSSAIGTHGSVIFSKGTGAAAVNLDTVMVTSVAKYPRYYIENKSANGLVIGNDSTGVYPALAVNNGDVSTKFIIRPVNQGVNDNLFFIIQDGNYKMMKKSPANSWDVLYGTPSEEAKWIITTQEDGSYSVITNSVTVKDLGTDDITVSSRLWDDKIFFPNPATKPFCEWKLNSIISSLNKLETTELIATYSGEFVNIHGTKSGDKVSVINLFGQMVKEITAQSDLTSINLKSGMYLIRVNDKTLKVVR